MGSLCTTYNRKQRIFPYVVHTDQHTQLYDDVHIIALLDPQLAVLSVVNSADS